MTALVVVVVLLLAGALAAVLLLDPNAYKAQIAAAVERATGRTLVLGGRLSLAAAFSPTIEAEDVSLSNMAGGSQPTMLKLARVEAEIALWPLLSGRLVLRRLVLIQPDILVETDQNGRINWRFTPQRKPAFANSSDQPKPRSRSLAEMLTIETVHIRDGHVTWHDGRSGETKALDLLRLDATAATDDAASAPMAVTAQMLVRGQSVMLTAQTGPLLALQQPEASAPWPMQVSLTGQGASLSVSGTVARPLEGRGYNLVVVGAADDLSALSVLAATPLPKLRAVQFGAKLADTDGPRPEMSAITLRAGASDLSSLVPGLALLRADVSAPALDQPAAVAAQGTLGGLPVQVAGTLAGLDMRTPDILVDVTAQAANAAATLKGPFDTRAAPAGHSVLHVHASIPDLAPLLAASPLAGHGLPTLTDIVVDGTLSPSLAGFAAKADPPAPAISGLLIPDTTLPLAMLRAGGADLHVSVGQMAAGGAALRDGTAHVVLQGGTLTLDPVTALAPGGRLDASARLEAGLPVPAASVALHAPALPVQPLLALFGYPDMMRGTADIDADLHATGSTAHAMAASLDGHAGIAMVDGAIGNQLLAALFANVAQAARLGGADLDAAGQTRLRCVAMRADAAHGMVTLSAMVLDSPRLLVQGGGTLNLADEALALRLRPLLRVGGPGLVVPVRVGGTLRTPKVTVDGGGTASSLAGLALGRADAAAGEHGSDACGLAAPAIPSAPVTTKVPNAGQLLRQLAR